MTHRLTRIEWLEGNRYSIVLQDDSGESVTITATVQELPMGRDAFGVANFHPNPFLDGPLDPRPIVAAVTAVHRARLHPEVEPRTRDGD